MVVALAQNEAALRLLVDFGFMEILADGDDTLIVQWTETGRALLKEGGY
jgi:hypothetical protein